MGNAQKFTIAYGFILDSTPAGSDLPESYVRFLDYAALILASKDVKLVPGRDIDFLYTMDLLIFGVYKKLAYAECCNQLVIFVENSASLYGDAPNTLDLTEPAREEKDHIEALSELFEKEPGWIIFPAE